MRSAQQEAREAQGEAARLEDELRAKEGAVQALVEERAQARAECEARVRECEARVRECEASCEAALAENNARAKLGLDAVQLEAEYARREVLGLKVRTRPHP